MKNRIFLTLIFCSALSMYSQTTPQSENEDKTATELKEVVVTGDNVWIEGDKIVFRPQKSAKNLATDATSLIELMHTGLLRVRNGNIQTSGGQNVNIFINGVPADNMDLSTFWPKNAIKVEYMQTSNDPKFLGRTNIVNFVMKDYVAGGLTKLKGDQTFPNEGKYSASSKLVWGKMTYNALFNGEYSRNHLSGSSDNETYRDVWYKGKHYDQITFDRMQDDISRSNDLYGGFNARYRTDKTIIKHDLLWKWNENPGGRSNGISYHQPAIIESDKVATHTHGRNITSAISGSYTFFSNRVWSYGGSWNFKYSHNNNFSLYDNYVDEEITTATKEDHYVVSAALQGSKDINDNMQIVAKISETRDVSDANYAGSVESNQWQSYGQTDLTVQWWYRPIKALRFLLTPSLIIYDWNINHDIKKTEWIPGVNFSLAWQINSKSSLSLGAWYTQNSPVSSMRNDLILHQTELKWLQGNPELNSSDSYWFDIDYYILPVKWLTVNFGLNYITRNSESAIIYRPGGSDFDGIIGEYINVGRYTNFMPQLDLSVSLFSGKLYLSNSLTYYLTSYSKLNSLSYWRVRPYVAWYFGNCSLSAYYYGKQKIFTNGGMGSKNTADGYGLTFSYGNGNLNCSLSIDNLFDKRKYETQTYSSDCFSSVGRNWSNGRSVSVSLTYTFDYGKKVTPGIDISEQNIQSTSVLGSDR